MIIEDHKNITEHKSPKEILITKLKPETFLDHDGNQRTAYTFISKNGNEVKAVFYSREEIPFSQNISRDKESFILGKQPKIRSKEEWNQFVMDANKNSHSASLGFLPNVPLEAIVADKALFYVESSPEHLIDFAIMIGASQIDLGDLRQQFAHKKISEKANSLMDAIIAVKLFDENGEIKAKNYDGEVLAILALNGNQEAATIMMNATKRVAEMDSETSKQANEKAKEIASNNPEKPVALEQLVAVHATNYPPRRNSDGTREIKTLFDATHWRMPRDTIHVALNHHVTGHLSGAGDWGASPFVVLAPMKPLVELNGKPAMLNPIDTFFEVSPGDTLHLPDNTYLVMPGVVEKGAFMSRGPNNEIYYKTRNVFPDDINALCEYVDLSVQKQINEAIIENLISGVMYGGDYQGNFDNADITQDDWLNIRQVAGPEGDRFDILSQMRTDDATTVLERFFSLAQIQDKVSSSNREFMIQRIKNIFVSSFKLATISTQLQEMNVEVWTGSSYQANSATGDVGNAIYALGAEMGVPAGALHTYSTEGMIDKWLLGGVGQGTGLLPALVYGTYTPKMFREEVYTKVSEKLKEASVKTRRMLYLTGII